MDQTADLSGEAEVLKAKLATLQSERDAAQRNLESTLKDLSDERTLAVAKHNEAAKLLNETEEKLKAAEQEVKTWKIKAGNAEDHVRQLKKKVADLEKMRPDDEVKLEREARESVVKENRELREKIKAMEAEISTLKASESGLKNELRLVDALRATMTMLENRMKKAVADMEETKKLLKATEERLDKAETLVLELKAKRELEEKKPGADLAAKKEETSKPTGKLVEKMLEKAVDNAVTKVLDEAKKKSAS